MADGNERETTNKGQPATTADLFDRHFLDMVWESRKDMPGAVAHRLCDVDKSSWAVRGLLRMIQADAFRKADAEDSEVDFKGLSAGDRETMHLAMEQLMLGIERNMEAIRDNKCTWPVTIPDVGTFPR